MIMKNNIIKISKPILAYVISMLNVLLGAKSPNDSFLGDLSGDSYSFTMFQLLLGAISIYVVVYFLLKFINSSILEIFPNNILIFIRKFYVFGMKFGCIGSISVYIITLLAYGYISSKVLWAFLITAIPSLILYCSFLIDIYHDIRNKNVENHKIDC